MVGRNVDHLAAEIAIRVVGCHHVQVVLVLVVNDGSVLARLLADAVLIAALGVDTQLAEHHVTLSVILRGGDDLAVGPVVLDLHELELELVLLELAAVERLVGAGHEGPRLLEHVDEPGLGAALVGDLAFQFPVTGVRRRNCQVARRGVVGHAGLGAGDLAHAVAVLAQRGHGHFAERHVTLGVILRGGDDLAVGTVGLHLKQLKRVGILLEVRALHALGRMGGKRALRLVTIGEHGGLRSGVGADVGNRALELAVIGLGRARSHRQVVRTLVIGDAGRRSGLLADAVAVLASALQLDLAERDLAVGIVCRGGDHVAVGIVSLDLDELEGELAGLELTAFELLLSAHGKAALGLHGVGVGDALTGLSVRLDRARHLAARLVARGDVELGNGVAQARFQARPGLGLAGREGELLAIARGVPVDAELELPARVALGRTLDLLGEGERAVAGLNGLGLVGEHGQRGLAVIGDVRAQGAVVGSGYLNRDVARGPVIGDAIFNMVDGALGLDLGDGVGIGSRLVIGD